jgi:hypothetical protein
MSTKISEVQEQVFQQRIEDALSLKCAVVLASMDEEDARRVADRIVAGDFSTVIDEDSGEVEFSVAGSLLFSFPASELLSR